MEVYQRDIAFSRLSRNEILNLLTRRMWTSLSRLNPANWRKAQKAPVITVSGRVYPVDVGIVSDAGKALTALCAAWRGTPRTRPCLTSIAAWR